MTPSRRKKWTEAEERTLIDKYKEMVSNGTLGKMKTREKKFKPIACYVNNMHHVGDPVAFPWQWTWKDVSTKVQNMRHQYLLVKQKIKKPAHESDTCNGDAGMSGDEFDWLEGLTHWSNFLRYKEVFGDVSLVCNGGEMVGNGIEGRENGGEGFGGVMEIGEFGQHSGDGDFGVGMDGAENGLLGLGFEYEARDVEENYHNHDENSDQMRKDGDGRLPYEENANESALRKKRKIARGLEKKVLGLLAHQSNQLKRMETQFEQREAEREQERERRDSVLMELEQERLRRWEEREKCREEREKAREELRRQRKQQWEAMEKESDARERRREEQLHYEDEWEERLNRRRSEWMKRMDEMLSQHRAEMGQVQARILHEQQNLTSQLLGMVAQFTGHTSVLSDPTGQNSHYLSQMMHQESGIVHDARVDGEDNQDDQFIVD
ncbi:unnamed protein product [Rhodiola kirilowii]